MRLDQVRRLSHPESLDVAITASMLAALLARDVTTHVNELAAQGPDSPAPHRTLFAVTLQIGRSRASLLALVRCIADGLLSIPDATHIARAILCGARARARDPHPRAVREAQRRTQPLTRMRRRSRSTRARRPPRHATARKEPM